MSPLFLHALRGVIGFGALAYVFSAGASIPGWATLAGVITSLVVFRGCPTCWLMATGELVSAKLAGRAPNATCANGTCEVPRRRNDPA